MELVLARQKFFVPSSDWSRPAWFLITVQIPLTFHSLINTLMIIIYCFFINFFIKVLVPCWKIKVLDFDLDVTYKAIHNGDEPIIKVKCMNNHRCQELHSIKGISSSSKFQTVQSNFLIVDKIANQWWLIWFKLHSLQ